LLLCMKLLLILITTNGAPQEDTDKRQCSEYNDVGYYCVPFYQCDEDSKIIIDGEGIVDPRSDIVHSLATTSQCDKLIDRCCLHPYKRDTTRGDPPQPPEGPAHKCGKRNMGGIVGVREYPKLTVGETEFGEWPHVCAVLENKSVSGTVVQVYLCGGSLLDAGVILTAAHCVKDLEPTNLMVRCGEWDTQAEDPLPYQEIGVDTIEAHPCFNNDNHHNNFALLFLQSKMSLASHIRPVCLPSPDHVFPARKACVSNGWGKDKFGTDGEYSNILKEIVVPIVENRKCQTLLRENTRLGPFFELDSSFLCAGGEKGVDTCKGDGGSPLTCKQEDGSWAQAGIVSWGIGCGGVGTPAVYANVARAACWIDNRISCYYGIKSFYDYTDRQCTRRDCEADRRECFKR